MKNVFVVLYTVSLSGLLMLSACNGNNKGGSATTGSISATSPVPVGGAKIAYVNMDSLESKYELLKAKREDFKAREEQMEQELQRSYQQMASDAQEVEKKARANTLTQTEYETANKRLNQQDQSLKIRKQTLTDQLMKEQEDFNKDLKGRLDGFLDEYNKTHNYDYILSYSYAGSPLLYVNKQYDITQDVVDGMNARTKKDAEKKK